MLVLMTAATASAQWAVADAPNLAQNVKNFSELQKQVGYLKEQKDRLDETLDMMRKVNSVISSCETAKSIIERQGRLSVNPEKPDVPLNKNDAFQKVQKRRVQEKR